MASTTAPIRRLAPRLAKSFFSHKSCVNATPFAPLKVANPATRNAFQSIRFYNSTAPLQSAIPVPNGTPLTGLSQTIDQSHKSEEKKKSFFPKISSRGVAFWLLGSAASVFGIVVFGGLTRLTESGYAYACFISELRYANFT